MTKSELAGGTDVVAAAAEVSTEYLVGGVRLPRPFSVHRLGHVGINVRDLGAALTFYRDVLGLNHTDDLSGPPGFGTIGHFTTFGSDHHSLVIVDERFGASDDDRARGGMTFNQISFQVGSLAEVVAARDFLVARHRTIYKVGRDSPGSNFAVYAFDPDGHRVELFYGMEQIGWDQRSKPPGMSPGMLQAPQLPVRAERREVDDWQAGRDGALQRGHRSGVLPASRFDVGGVMLPRPFRVVDQGPLALFVTDVDASTGYYQDVYGFALTERVDFRGHRCAFLRVNGTHHSLALLPEVLRADLNGAHRSTVMALGFRLGDYTQLRDAVDFLGDQGFHVNTTVHRALHPGIEEAAYVEDPDGNRVLLYSAIEQIGWDGRPRPAEARRVIPQQWNSTLGADTDTHQGRTFLGPLG